MDAENEVMAAQIIFKYLTEEDGEALLEHQRGKDLLMSAIKILNQYPEVMANMGLKRGRCVIKMASGSIIDFGDLSKPLDEEPIQFLN